MRISFLVRPENPLYFDAGAYLHVFKRVQREAAFLVTKTPCSVAQRSCASIWGSRRIFLHVCIYSILICIGIFPIAHAQEILQVPPGYLSQADAYRIVSAATTTVGKEIIPWAPVLVQSAQGKYWYVVDYFETKEEDHSIVWHERFFIT